MKLINNNAELIAFRARLDRVNSPQMLEFNESWRALLDLFREPVFIVSSEDHCVFANASFLNFLSLKQKDTAEKPVTIFWPEFSNTRFNSSVFSTEFSSRTGEKFRVRMIKHDLDSGLRLFKLLDGTALNASSSGFHSQRLQALGVLASGIAHDFNNVLAGVLGHVTYLKTILPAAGPHVESIKAIEEGARRSTLMTQQILGFSRADSLQKVNRVEVGNLVTRTLQLLKGAVSSRYTLIQHIPKQALHVLAEESKIAQILVNLVINARDASKPGANITVSVNRVDDAVQVKTLFEGGDPSAKSLVEICVEDHGHGMTTEVLDRAFEPYFSTKDERGTGLGLFTVDSIVKSFGGLVRIISEVDRGTSVYVYLPLIEGEDQAGKSTKAPEIKGGSERILVIDDEYAVRNVLSLSLKHLGYTIDLAGSGREALDQFKHARQFGNTPYDLVLLDILMPHLSGAEVFECLREIQPDVNVLVMSGYAAPDVIQGMLANGARGFIQKPFTIDELSVKVREALGGKR